MGKTAGAENLFLQQRKNTWHGSYRFLSVRADFHVRMIVSAPSRMTRLDGVKMLR